MAIDDVKRIAIPHLRDQFAKAAPILFTGAGFSQGAKGRDGKNLPSVDTLKKELWSLCFPDATFDPRSSLQDLYNTALRSSRNALIALLNKSFTADADSLPSWYRWYFSMPWARSYTVNIDDLARACARKFVLPRELLEISAASDLQEPERISSDDFLEVVHLNGMLCDVPDNVTFSVLQYAERLARPEPWYIRLSADLLRVA